MENENSTNEVENGKKSIENLKQKFIIASGIIIGIIFIILISFAFISKKEDLGIKDDKSAPIISEITEQKDQPIKKFSDYNELKDFLESNSNNVAGEPMYGNAIDSDEVDMVLEEGGMARKYC